MVNLINFNLEKAYQNNCTSNARELGTIEEYEAVLASQVEHLKEMKNSTEYHDLVATAKALSSEMRIQILLFLHLAQSSCFCELTGLFNIKDSTLTYHIKLLKAAKLVKTEKNGKFITIKIAENIHDKVPKTIAKLFA